MERSEQGRTRPFLCRGDDDRTYWVKGKTAGRMGLAAEVLGFCLARELGLPVPEGIIAEVPIELIEAGLVLNPELADLGSGPAFGSLVVQATEFVFARVHDVSPELAEALAVFDWWIRNEDRTLTELGGNPNLLWEVPPHEGLVVIDHNLAFGEIDRVAFMQTHVFAEKLAEVSADFERRQYWAGKLTAALNCWDEACSYVPMEWGFIDQEQTIPSNLNLEDIRAKLQDCLNEEFWQIP
ncbi:HipA family kinase [Caenimonas terrae]|uniref:HipA family kinase n=1 Tax=Caenimonas terrae TaxID=696074 RepID=UPI0036700AD4